MKHEASQAFSRHKRSFLRNTLYGAGGSAALAAFPPAIRKALAIPANNRTGTIRDVEHVVILMQENRSFDHYFGTLPGVRGFADRITIPLPEGRSVWEQSNGKRIVMPYHLDSEKGNAQRVLGTPHDYPNAQKAWDGGRMTQWPAEKTDRSMGYYQEQEVEFQAALADAFTICDAYHCAFHGGTNTNRLFHWSGTNDPYGQGNGPSTRNRFDSLDSPRSGWTWKTYPERLQEAGVSWKLYQNLPDNFTDNPLAGFQQYRQANKDHGNLNGGLPYPAWQPAFDAGNPLYKGVANTMPDGGFLQSLREDIASGMLPQVSWIVAPAFYSEHPLPSSPIQGAWYISEVLDALTANPEVWSKTVLIINFDENDGFFDHVPSPAAPSLNPDGSVAGDSTEDTSAEYHRVDSAHDKADGKVYGPGPRVPMYVVSPWSRGGWVNSQAFDHTSVLRFLEARFGVAESNISPWRRAVMGDLSSCFDFSSPNTGPLPELVKLEKEAADRIRLSQALKLPVPVPSVSAQSTPVQALAIRPSRALPYEMHTSARTEPAAGGIWLLFSNTGTQAGVFHVYDKLHLDRVPRRYTVGANRQLNGFWNTVDQDNGRYDLWVLGPNGFHRHFQGNTNQQMLPDVAAPEIRVCYDIASGDVYLELLNRGSEPYRATVRANAYLGDEATREIDVPAGDTPAQLHWDLSGCGHWYDFSVTVEGLEGWTRRFAGRVETGKDAISDPAMGHAGE
ncbi:phospholipase C [Kerstersia gyiorum]|uniref:phosphocholine-specific phospholipase C n=1 Tax=Kerstersia gyiorum TaxID=206506 RepID=UPI00209F36B1|nr:phospholipase C, phosphocholine-specific [Kerstersia gyiorum]MCP1637636.1 phospholipase C [Kerstersia gyiorum]